MSDRKSIRKFNRVLKELNSKGYVVVDKQVYLAANYVLKVLDADHNSEFYWKGYDRLNAPCRIIYSKIGEKQVIMRELIKMGHNPSEGKFIDVSKLANQ